jgi:hypothetical protein
VTVPGRRRGRATWWLYYLVAAALGVLGGLGLFEWVTR